MTTRSLNPIQRAIQINPIGELDPSYTSRVDQIRRTRAARTTAAAPTPVATAGTRTSPPPATAPAPAPAPVAAPAPVSTTQAQAAPTPQAAPPAPTPEPNAPLTNRQGLVDVIFGSGAGVGDPTYWYSDRPGENNDLVNAAVRGLNDPAQRQQILDFLFSSGLAQGDRNYWTQNRGAEEASLVGVLNQALGGTVGQEGDGASAPAPSAGGGTPSNEKDIEQLRNERLEAALSAIEAQFATQRGSLEGQQAGLGNLFRLSMAQNLRGQGQAQERVESNASQRGLGRSGFFGQNLVDALVPFQEQRQDLIGRINPEAGAEGTEIRQILSQLGLLDQQRASAESQARIQSEMDALDLEQLLQLMNAGLQ